VGKSSQSSRLVWKPFAISCAALVPLLIAGCQSNVQQDQVVRELRMQEDQMYAMEDYLAQYQQLICKYREENAALRRQLAEEGGMAAPTRRTTPRPRNGTPSGLEVPEIEIPDTPRTNGTQPPEDLEAPEIPALEETTSVSPMSRLLFGKVNVADGENEPTEPAGVVQASAVAVEPAHKQNTIREVRLRGEVTQNDAGGGPRLVVDVEPLDESGNATHFDGALSLMLLVPDSNGGQRSVARWDYGPKEVRAAKNEADEQTLQFRLELPPDTSVNENYELWARLLPRRGGKLLTHVDIDFEQSGSFASLAENSVSVERPKKHDVETADYQEVGSSPPPIKADLYDGGWTIARPGELAGSPPDGQGGSGNGWRESLEPPPEVVASKERKRNRPRVSRPSHSANIETAAASELLKPVGWSPERPGDSSADTSRATASRPRWSATR
jgi:hypothetical protein